MSEPEGNMKIRVARTLKWNVFDKLSTQVLYAVTGVILARVLSEADFGLVGAVLVFQAFASMFIEGGFSYALIQRKEPTERDYSSVFWFNMAMAVGLYIILFFSAPLIAGWFQNDVRLIALSRVMFLSFIINTAAIVPTSRLMKRMEVKMVAVSNSLGLIAGAVVGIVLALTGFGPWALVWQTIALASVKTSVLWISTRWRPIKYFSWAVLRSFFRVGGGMLVTSFLNTLFLNAYSFIIGNRAGLVSLGYYTQADKWSKMGVQSLSQVLTSSFLPVLSKYQDQPERYAAVTSKMNRFTAYLALPALGMLMVLAAPIFHILFGTKWDPSIILFQLLLLRGMFTVMSSLYNNYVVSLGKARLIVYTELIRDGAAVLAIIATLPYLIRELPGNPTWGIGIFLWGQLAASVVAWAVMLVIVSKVTWRTPWQYLRDIAPYVALTIVVCGAMLLEGMVLTNAWALIFVQGLTGLGLYLGINRMLRSKVQADVLEYILGRFRRK